MQVTFQLGCVFQDVHTTYRLRYFNLAYYHLSCHASVCACVCACVCVWMAGCAGWMDEGQKGGWVLLMLSIL